MKQFAITTSAVILGVFVAGLIMNAARDMDVVKNAIRGYDA